MPVVRLQDRLPHLVRHLRLHGTQRGHDPVHALGRFALYVVSEEWGEAYEGLAASNREKLGFLEFRVGAPFVKDPVTGAPIFEIIEKSARTRYRLDADPQNKNSEQVEITYHGKDAESGQRVIRVIEVEMLDERAVGSGQADWKIDLLSTVERLSGLRR